MMPQSRFLGALVEGYLMGTSRFSSSVQFWLASLLWGLMVGVVGLVVFVVVLFIQNLSR